jgi:hypothetical protein
MYEKMRHENTSGERVKKHAGETLKKQLKKHWRWLKTGLTAQFLMNIIT